MMCRGSVVDAASTFKIVLIAETISRYYVAELDPVHTSFHFIIVRQTSGRPLPKLTDSGWESADFNKMDESCCDILEFDKRSNAVTKQTESS
jgi:hypothetical protein